MDLNSRFYTFSSFVSFNVLILELEDEDMCYYNDILSTIERELCVLLVDRY